MKNKKETIYLTVIFFCALILRLAYNYALSKNYFFYFDPSDDVLYYRDWAQEIARHSWLGNKVFYGLPLYPYFLAVLDRLTLGNIFPIRLCHLILGSFNCLLVYSIAKKIFSEKVGRLAAILTATNFILIYYDGLMMPVTLIISLSLVIILSLLSMDETTQRREWFLLGTLIGLATLADGKFLFFLFFILLNFFYRNRKTLGVTAKKIALPLCAGVIMILSTVTLRNWVVGKDFVFISAQSGMAFYLGNNPQASGIFENPDFLHPTHGGHDEDPQIIAESILKKNLKPSEVSAFWQRQALDFIANNPTQFMKLLANKFTAFFRQDENADDIDLILQREWRHNLDINPFFLICPLALLGIALSRHTNPQTRFLNFLILGQLILTLLFYLLTRYRATLLPFLIIYEAYAMFWLYERLKNRNAFAILAALLFTVFFCLILPPKYIDKNAFTFLWHAKAGPIFAQQGEFAKAKEAYGKALAINPMDANTLYNLGNAYLEENNPRAAITTYENVLKLTPYDTSALYNLAYAYEVTGAIDTAIETYEKVLKLSFESYDAHMRLAEIYRAKGQCANAAEHYRVILNTKPQFAKEIDTLLANCGTKSR